MKRALVFALLMLAIPSLAQEAFTFTALGDMPYTLPDDYPKFEQLISTINQSESVFSIHIGDIKSGSSPCTDEVFARVHDLFGTFEQALIYTPGDNEWTDCHREAAGNFDPLERLAAIRAMFFQDDMSFGENPIQLEHQEALVENTRWQHNGVVFATVHVVGSNNGFERTPASAAEFFERDAANLAWLRETFASAQDAPALVLAFHANPSYDVPSEYSRANYGFQDFLSVLAEEAAAFGKPVLLIQGDEHALVIDQPLLDEEGEPLTKVTRLQVMGADQVQAVQVTVDPAAPMVFGFEPIAASAAK